MTIESMRTILKTKTKYKNTYTWVNKVNKMSDNQVTAVYFCLLRSGGIQG